MPSSATVQAVALAMYDLQRVITAEGRMRTTTGGIFDRITTGTVHGTGFVSGHLEADDYWRYVGNGRGPGGMPPVDNIRAWLERAGIAASPWAIAKSIAKRGTRAHRRGDTNIFEAGIDKWEGGASVSAAEDAAGRELEDAAIDVIRTNLKRAS